MGPEEELRNLMGDFLSGADRSIQLVGEIEEVVVGNFLDTELFEFLAEPLSLYRPGENMPYVDETEMVEVLREAINMIPQAS